MYCFHEFDWDVPVTEDHVIARKFVPQGTMKNQWNVIAKACPNCNRDKADLEGEISAASMLPWPGTQSADVARRDGLRKAQKQRSHRTGRRMSDSPHRDTITVELSPNTTATFGIVGPPQVDDERIERLACFQMAGLFYALSWSEQNRIGKRWPGSFGMRRWARRTDWGNAAFRHFMALARSWDAVAVLQSGQGHFKVMLRMNPTELVWAWALEWNQNFRCIGFLGEDQQALTSMALVADPEPHAVMRDGNRTISLFKEQSLVDEDDLLFSI